MNEFNDRFKTITPLVKPVTIGQATVGFKFLISRYKKQNPIVNKSRWRFHELETGQSIFNR